MVKLLRKMSVGFSSEVVRSRRSERFRNPFKESDKENLYNNSKRIFLVRYSEIWYNKQAIVKLEKEIFIIELNSYRSVEQYEADRINTKSENDKNNILFLFFLYIILWFRNLQLEISNIFIYLFFYYNNGRTTKHELISWYEQ